MEYSVTWEYGLWPTIQLLPLCSTQQRRRWKYNRPYSVNTSIKTLFIPFPYFKCIHTLIIWCSSKSHKHSFEFWIQLHHRQRVCSRSSNSVQDQVLLELQLVSIPSSRHVFLLLSLRDVSPRQTYEQSTNSKGKTVRWNQDT